MSKNKNKMRKSGKPVIDEDSLLKSLNELEEAVLKGGDELLDQDPEGGLSTEGTPLSDKAPKGKTAVAKSDDDSEADDDDVEKGGDEDDMSGDDASEDDESADDDSGDDDESAPPMPMNKGKKVSKSLRERADEDDTMSKAIEVSDFIEAMVENTSETIADVAKSLHDANDALGNRLDKSLNEQREFNSKMAKGIVLMGRALHETLEMVKSLANQPNVPQRRSVLSKSEVVDPHRQGDDDQDADVPEYGDVTEWLFQKSLAGEISPLLVTQFEIHRDLGALPPEVRKALTNDLMK